MFLFAMKKNPFISTANIGAFLALEKVSENSSAIDKYLSSQGLYFRLLRK